MLILSTRVRAYVILAHCAVAFTFFVCLLVPLARGGYDWSWLRGWAEKGGHTVGSVDSKGENARSIREPANAFIGFAG